MQIRFESVRYLLLIILFGLTASLIAQQEDLLQQQKALNKKIDLSNYYLSTINAQTSISTGQLVAIQENIDLSRALVSNTEQRISIMETEVNALDLKLDSLACLKTELEKEYHEILATNYKRNLVVNPARLLFSRDLATNMITRQFLSNKYQSYLKGKQQELSNLTQDLDSLYSKNVVVLNQSRVLVDSLLNQQNALNTVLALEKQKIQELNNSKTQIQTTISLVQSEREKVNSNIERYIGQQIDKTDVSTGTVGKIDWPIKGVITSKFGRHRHPTLPDVMLINNGIDIIPYKSKEVHCVLAGTVVRRDDLPTGILILVKRDNYFFLYSQLQASPLNIGDEISENGLIGTVRDELHFEIWERNKKINPENWLN